jgi:hypothetical protein
MYEWSPGWQDFEDEFRDRLLLNSGEMKVSIPSDQVAVLVLDENVVFDVL